MDRIHSLLLKEDNLHFVDIPENHYGLGSNFNHFGGVILVPDEGVLVLGSLSILEAMDIYILLVLAVLKSKVDH